HGGNHRGPGAANRLTPRSAEAAELAWAIDEFQGFRRSRPYPPDGLEMRLDCHCKGSGGLGRPHASCPQTSGSAGCSGGRKQKRGANTSSECGPSCWTESGGRVVGLAARIERTRK